MGANVAPTSQEANYRQNNNEKLESTQVSYQPHGSHQIFNPTINVCSGRIDSDRENPRMWAPNCSNIAQLPISKEQYGSMKSKQCYSDNDINVVRIQPDILNAFKNNPYTQSLESWG
jgi:hypothetical protein